MNIVAIILGIIIIMLFFILYKYFTTTASVLTSSTLIDLKLDQTSNAITKINTPQTNQYAYGIWLYINSWDSGTPKTIFNHNGAMKVYMDSNSPSLKVDISTSDSKIVTTTVTDNFPLQKWVFIIASMDTSFLDVYLDGKLIKSVKITNASEPSSSPTIYLGNNNPFKPFKAYVTRFYRWTNPMDPGTAWNYYMKGNGQTGFLGYVNGYGVKMQVLQNNIETASYQLM
jgi:hypothetical protein